MPKKYSKAKIAEWKRNRKKWVNALRSGEYRQAKERLFDGDAYCCLGVLCRVAGINAVLEEDGSYTFDGFSKIAPDKAMEFVGLSDEAGTYARGDAVLASKNDFEFDFGEIADIIESDPPGLFLESVEEQGR